MKIPAFRRPSQSSCYRFRKHYRSCEHQRPALCWTCHHYYVKGFLYSTGSLTTIGEAIMLDRRRKKTRAADAPLTAADFLHRTEGIGSSIGRIDTSAARVPANDD